MPAPIISIMLNAVTQRAVLLKGGSPKSAPTSVSWSSMAFASASGLHGLSGRAYYAARVGDFLAQHDDTVLAALATSTTFAIETTQRCVAGADWCHASGAGGRRCGRTCRL
jgi:hypothetical protein